MATINGFLINSESINSDIVEEAHTGFTFNGNCILDSVAIQNYAKTDAQVLETRVKTLPDWTPDMKFLASFNGTTDGSNVFGMTSSPTSWSLYRREYGGSVLTKVCDCDINVMEWTDYLCEGNKSYEWLIFAHSDEQISEPIITDVVKTSFYGYFLLSSDADNINDSNINNNVEVFEFNLNLTSDKVTKNNDVTQLKTYGRFDKNIIGNRCFRSGTFTSVIIPFDDENYYDFEAKMNWRDYLEELDLFLSDKGYKYLKNRSGQIMKISTHGAGSDYDLQFTEDMAIGENNQQMNLTIYFNEVGLV